VSPAEERRYQPLRPGRHRLPREFVINSQRDRLLDSMAECCLARGYDAVTVADVVTRARVSRATFYELFKDKEDCFLAAYDAILAKFTTAGVTAYSRAELTWPQRVHSGINALLEFLAAEPAFAWMCIIEAPAAGPRAIERYAGAIRLISSFLEEGRRHSPNGDEIPARVPGALVGGLALMVAEQISEGKTESLPDLVPDLVFAVLVPFIGRKAARAEAASGPPA